MNWKKCKEITCRWECLKGSLYLQIPPILDVSKESQRMCEKNSTKVFPLPLVMKKQKPRRHCRNVVLKASQDEFLFSLQRIFSLEAVSYSVSGAYVSRIVVVFSACVSTGKGREHIWEWDVRKTIFTKIVMDTETASHKAGHFPQFSHLLQFYSNGTL